jgi:hypothetical protein
MHTLRIARTAASSVGSSAVSSERGAPKRVNIRAAQSRRGSGRVGTRVGDKRGRASLRRSGRSVLQQTHDVVQQALRPMAVFDVHQLGQVRLCTAGWTPRRLHGCSLPGRRRKAKRAFAQHGGRRCGRCAGGAHGHRRYRCGDGFGGRALRTMSKASACSRAVPEFMKFPTCKIVPKTRRSR